MSFLTKAYFIISGTHIRKIRLIADVTAEIFKIKNCSVGNLFKYTLSASVHGFSDECYVKPNFRYRSVVVPSSHPILFLFQYTGSLTSDMSTITSAIVLSSFQVLTLYYFCFSTRVL